MTWGQFRLQLQISAPGVPHDLLDEAINTTYQEILDFYPWIGIDATAYVETQAAYQSVLDTVTATVGSNLVAGTLTSWTSALVGTRFYIPSDQAYYTITAVGGATSLTLDRVYEGYGSQPPGTVVGPVAYTFFQHIYDLPSDLKSVREVLDAVTQFPLAPFTKRRLDMAAGTRNLVANPTGYAVYDDTPEASPPVLHQIEFFPPPQYAYGYAVHYRRAANAFTGSNTSSVPLTFVSDSAILNGSRSKILLGMKDYNGSERYASRFAAALNLMVKVELQRKPSVSLAMAPIYTRHRMQRTARGFNNNWGPGQGGPN